MGLALATLDAVQPLVPSTVIAATRRGGAWAAPFCSLAKAMAIALRSTTARTMLNATPTSIASTPSTAKNASNTIRWIVDKVALVEPVTNAICCFRWATLHHPGRGVVAPAVPAVIDAAPQLTALAGWMVLA